MFKNILAKGIAISLAVLFFFTSFSSGTKNANAAPGPAIFTLGLLAGAILGRAGLEMNRETFMGLHETLPPNTFRGPHFILEKETYWSENISGQKQIWDKRKGKWLPKK